MALDLWYRLLTLSSRTHLCSSIPPPVCSQTLASIQRLSTALNILEKYGCNLTNPTRPKYWRTVKLNNPVFRSTVDAIQVSGLCELLEDHQTDSVYAMLCYAILCYTTPYWTILYYAILCYAMPYYTMLHYTTPHYTGLYCPILDYTVLYNTVPTIRAKRHTFTLLAFIASVHMDFVLVLRQ